MVIKLAFLGDIENKLLPMEAVCTSRICLAVQSNLPSGEASIIPGGSRHE